MSNNNTNDKKSENIILDEAERKLVMDHSYDGIEEFDYPLPSWWLMTFIGGIVFAVAYWFVYQVAHAPNLRQEFEKDWAVIAAKKAEMKAKSGTFDYAAYDKVVADGGVQKGEQIFTTNCVACHKEHGSGDIGPNLSDDAWLVAVGTPAGIYKIVKDGSVANGMPNWGETLSGDDMMSVVAYIKSLHGFKHTVKAKEAQGKEIALADLEALEKTERAGGAATPEATPAAAPEVAPTTK